ncbi:autotransporter adhesin family protein, partial [Anabaenopsis sp. FSS-46]|uniref:beta strand repeat-containing protein n=1 Tax=Anabaenopsis sp. FSS-46 TaxID=2971766 RepID=UPI002473F80E
MDIIQPTTNGFSPEEFQPFDGLFKNSDPFHPPNTIQQITPYVNPGELIIELGLTTQEGTQLFSPTINIDPLTGQTWDDFLTGNFAGNSVNFLGTDKADDLYLRVNPEQRLEFSVDGTYFYHLNGLTLSSDLNISADLGSGDDRLYLDSSLIESLNSTGAQFNLDGGEDNDTIFGPDLDTIWNITGQNSGNLSNIEFSHVENLKAAENNHATFVFTPEGSLDGLVDGGDGNLGKLVIDGGEYIKTEFIANSAHSGEIHLDDKTIRYAGLAVNTIIDSSTTTDKVFQATGGDDDILVQSDNTGKITISSSNSTFQTVHFDQPSNSLTIRGLAGNDTITIQALDPNFSQSLIIDGEDGKDTVIFAQNLTLQGGSVTVNAENITVNSDVTIDLTKENDTDGIITFTASDTQSGFNASGAVEINLTGATLKAGDINLSAASTVTGSAIGLPAALINLTSTARINIIDTRIESSGNVTLASISQVEGTATATGLSEYTDSTADAAVATSIIESIATTNIFGVSSLLVDRDLNITADNDINVTTSGDASAAQAGAGIAIANITGITEAYIEGASIQGIQASNITISADSQNNIRTTATASPGGATNNSETPESRTENQAKTSDGTVEVAGALAFTKLNSQTQAYIASDNINDPNINTDKLTIKITSNNTQHTIGDSSNVGNSAQGVGVAVAVSIVDINNHAYIGSNTSINAGQIDIIALTPTGEFTTQATSGGGGSDVGVAGALAVHILNSDTKAQINSSAIIDVNQGDVKLEAQNQNSSQVTAQAAQSGGETLGIGASIGLAIQQNQTIASIENDAILNNARNLNLSAASDNTIDNSATAGSAGGIAATPALALTIASNETSALIGSGNILTLGSLEALASHKGNSSTLADAAAAGDSVGMGAALALNFVDDITIATTQRNITAAGDVSLSAHSYASSDSEAKASAGGAEAPEEGDEEQTSEDQINTQLDSVDTPNKEEHKNAIAGKTRTTEGQVSIAAALALNLANSTATATLGDGIVINAAGQLKLATSSETDASAIADGSAVGESAIGIGVAVALNIVDITNTASIGTSEITASGITLQAKMSDETLGGDGTSDFTAQATSGAGATNVGLAGSFALNYTGENASLAVINSGAIVDVRGGNITLEAENNTNSITEAKAIQEGEASVGIGASVALDIERNKTEAALKDNVTLTNAAKLTLSATSDNNSQTSSQTGAAGGIALSPGLAMTIVTNQTQANIGAAGTTGLLELGEIEATSRHTGKSSTTADGAAAGSTVGVGASLAINIVDDITESTTARDITAQGDISFTAQGYGASESIAKASAEGVEAPEEEPTPPEEEETPPEEEPTPPGEEPTPPEEKEKPKTAEDQAISAISSQAATKLAIDLEKNQIIFTENHYLLDGQVVKYNPNGNTPIGGLTDGRQYKVKKIDDLRVQLLDSTTNNVIDLTSDSSGAHSLSYIITSTTPAYTSNLIDIYTNEITFSTKHDLKTGDKISYYNPAKFPIKGKAIGGTFDTLTQKYYDVTVYYVIKVDDDTIKLARTRSDALSGKKEGIVNINSKGIGDQVFTLVERYDVTTGKTRELGYYLPSTINVSGNESNVIELTYNHGLKTGQGVVVQIHPSAATPKSPLSGINTDTYDNKTGYQPTEAKTYYVKVISSKKIQLAETLEDFNNNVFVTVSKSTLENLSRYRFMPTWHVGVETVQEQGQEHSVSFSAKNAPVDENPNNPPGGEKSEERKEKIQGQAKTSDGAVSVAAGLALNLARSTAKASLGTGVVINTGGTFKLAASNETDASAIADGSAVGESAFGIGVAVALNIVDITNEAKINNNITASGIILQAKMSDETLGG